MKELELEFTKLVREYRKTIYTVCYFFSNNPQDVDLARKPEHLLQCGTRQEADCTNRSAGH